MSSPKVLFGFHAVGVRLKTAPQSIIEIYYEATRRDARMRQFLDRAREAGARLIEADSVRIAKLAGAPQSPCAGIDLLVRSGDFVERGQPLFTLHAASPGELAYALEYAQAQEHTVQVAEDA